MAEKKFIIEVRTKGFAKANRDMGKLDTSSKSYEKTTDRMRGKTAGFIRSLGSLRNKILVYSFAIGAATKVTSTFVQAASKFQDVKVRLVGLMGGVLDAERAFQKFNTVAAKTPFTLDDVVNAGAQLKAFGADAEALLGPVTDLAAYMGTTATEAANAFGRAYAGGAGEADIFRTKGVLNIIRDFKGIEDLTDLTLPQFRRAMEETFTNPSTGIAGSTERLAKTFTGAMSNMGDSMTRLAAEIGDIFLPALTASARKMGEMADSMREAIQFAREGRETINLFGDGLDVFAAKLRGTKDIAELTRMMKEMEEQMGVNKKDMAEMGDIVSIQFIPPKAVDNLKTFTLLLGDATINTDDMQKGLTLIPGQMKLWTGAVKDQTATQDIMNVGSETYIAKLKLMIERIAELRAEEIKRNDILSDTNMEDVLRQERIDALISLRKMEADEIARNNALLEIAKDLKHDTNLKAYNELQEMENAIIADKNELLDDQVARMENAAMARAGMLTGTEDLVSTQQQQIIVANQVAGSINAMSSAMRNFSDEEMTAIEKTQEMIKIMGSLMMVLGAGTPVGAVGSIFTALGSIPVGHTGGLIKDNGIQRFAQGGMVQGQDNVPIMAQAGEFIMRRDAVQNIGVQNLAQMNKSGQGGGVTVNIQGNMIGNDEFIRDSLLPQIAKASQQNLA